MDTSDQAIVRALRRLTIAVWALVLVVALFVAMYLVAYVPWLRFSWNSLESPRASQSGTSSRSLIPYERFHDLPIEKQIEAVSVIAIARYQKDGEKLKCVISEILKRSPNTAFLLQSWRRVSAVQSLSQVERELWGWSADVLCW